MLAATLSIIFSRESELYPLDRSLLPTAQVGFFSKSVRMACTAVSHPDDVIKTRMQTHLRGSPLCAARVIRHPDLPTSLSLLFRVQ